MTTKSTAESTCSSNAAIAWNQTDSLLLGVLALAALVTRFVNLGRPDELVFDELQFVGQALAYWRGEQFIDVHPNLPKLLIAGAIKLFGTHPWSWRIPSACLGTALVLVTFLLGREMFRSRMAAVLAALFVLCDGMFLVHSRVAMLEIFHVTFTATSYLLLFQLLRTRDPLKARRQILLLGLVLGAALASKLLLPEIAFLIVTGFVLYNMLSPNRSAMRITNPRVIGTLILLGSVSSLVYLATFLPNYWLGWWGGAGAMLHYYHEVLWELGQISESTNNFVSPWWSWPLMLRAPLYWQGSAEGGLIATVWAGGNPVLWWSSLGALVITIAREVERPNLSRSFMLIAYFSYMGALSLSKHGFYLYIYMTPLYLLYLMLAMALADCWKGTSRKWEDAILVITLTPACILGLGTTIGILCLVGIAAAYVIFAWRSTLGGKFVYLVLVTASLAAFVYFYPVWVATPMAPESYNSRIWLNRPGVAKWM